MRNLIVPICLSMLLPACAVGPDYVRPETAEPGRFIRAEAEVFPAGEGEAQFWQEFGDPLLTTLVEDALSANHDLQIAAARYEQARAFERHTRFDRVPTVTAGATAADVRSSAGQMPGVSRGQRDFESYEVRVEAAWELDLFGRVRRSVEAQQALTDSSHADLSAVQVAVVGELVRGYFELRGLQQQLQVARGNAANQRGTLDLVQARLEAGRGTDLDVARARGQLEGTLALIPVLEGEIAVTMHRLAVLTGREPGALSARLSEPEPMPALAARVPVGTPGEVLRRRPDVRSAERRLAASTARVGIATSDLYPRFTLGGLIGSQAADLGALFEREAETRFVALGVDWSFLDAGRVRTRIAAADADADAHLAHYRQTVLLALEETESAMARYAHARREQIHLEQAAATGSRAARLARLRFDAGAVGFLEVLDAERAQLEAEARLAQGRTRAAVALVALYRSLAGGWET
jgi:outer membrane protein, multidrug efflux system